MSQYAGYTYDDDEEEEEFERKIYIDDDDEDDISEDGEANSDEADEELSDDEFETVVERNSVKRKENFGKAGPSSSKRVSTLEEPVAKKPKFETSKQRYSEEIEIKVDEDEVTYNIPTIQQTIQQRQYQQQNSFTCPLCFKHCLTKQNFDRHLLVHDDVLTTLQLYYWEDNPGEHLEEATEEFQLLRASKKPKPINVTFTGGNAEPKQAFMYIDGEYYSVEDGKKLITRKSMEEIVKSKTKEPSNEEALEKLIQSEFFY